MISAATFSSVADLWHHRVGSTPDGHALIHRSPEGWRTLTWRDVDRRIRALANGLLALGLEPGQRCCILSTTRVEWILVDLAILNAGCATTTIYPTSPPDDCGYIIGDSDGVVVFAEDDTQVAKLQAVRNTLPDVRKVVVFQGHPSADGWVETLAAFERRGALHAEQNPDAYPERTRAIQPDHLATLIYTSGTTGRPKGVMLTHDAWIYEAEALDLLGILSPADRQLLFLPLAHVFAKVLLMAWVRLGMPTVVDGRSETLFDTMAHQRPTFMAAVPRIYERAQAAILQRRDEGSFLERATFDWALDIGRRVSTLRQARQRIPTSLRIKHRLANRLVYQKIKDRFGGDLRFFISGGAPLAPEIASFFHALDILILEGWGLTETAAATAVNLPDDYRFGTVGKPLPRTEIKFEDDGEILVRNRGVMRGYHKDPENTERVLTPDGFLRTGDIGAFLDSGHLKITDRKKDLIITAAGKNVAPAHFANLLTARCPYVAHVVVHGDRRPYCSALVALDAERTRAWAEKEGLAAKSYSELAALEVVEALVAAHVDEINRTLPTFEMVRRFALLPEPLTEANGLLTPSLKVKRAAVEERYADLLDSLYERGRT